MNPVDALPHDIRRWLPRLGAMQGGGLESLIKAISGLGQVGPKPDFAPGANARTWPRLRRALEQAGLLEAQATGHTDAPLLRFAPALSDWLHAHEDTDTRLQTTRAHQRHYFQFAGQLAQRAHREPAASAALTRLELANLRHAAAGVLAQNEEWGLEFVDRLGALGDAIDAPLDDLRARAADLARRLGSAPWRLHLSNRAHRLFEAGHHAEAEAALRELLAGLDESAAFERASAWARIAPCRAANGDPGGARAALDQAAELTLHLARGGRDAPPSDAVLTLRRNIALDRIPFHDDARATPLWAEAVRAHAALASTRAALSGYADFIARIRAARDDPDAAHALARELAEARAAGWTAGAAAVERLLAGDADLGTLTRELDLDDAALIATLLDAPD